MGSTLAPKERNTWQRQSYDFPHSYGKQCRAAREFAERHYSDTRQWVDADTALGYYTGTGDLDEALWWYRMDSGGREEAAVRY